jgi:AcrR family transcriptional regulator
MSVARDISSISRQQPALRGDAARNAQRILVAGRALLRENPQASAEDIARAAGLGVATLYRRFPTREDLIRGIVESIFESDIAPLMIEAENEPDPRKGLRMALEGQMRVAIHEGITMPAGMTLDIAQLFLDPMSRILSRCQQQGLVRADLDPEKDTLRIILMLLGVLPTFNPGNEGWQRYVSLVMESLVQTPTEPLPPAEPIVDPWQRRK